MASLGPMSPLTPTTIDITTLDTPPNAQAAQPAPNLPFGGSFSTLSSGATVA